MGANQMPYPSYRRSYVDPDPPRNIREALLRARRQVSGREPLYAGDDGRRMPVYSPAGHVSEAGRRYERLPVYRDEGFLPPTMPDVGFEGVPATRARVVTGMPSVALPRTRAERIAAMSANRPVDENGRLRSGGLRLLTAPTQPTDSWGNLLGQKLGHFLGGVVRPQQDEEQEQAQDIKREQVAMAAEEVAAKQRREQEAHQSEVELRQAQAANQRALPTHRDQEQQRKEGESLKRATDQRRRAVASMINDVEEFDPDDPKNTQTVADLRELKLPVVAKKRGQQLVYKQDARTGDWYVLSGDKTTGTATSSAVTAPGGEGPLRTTSPQKMMDDFRRTKLYEDLKQKQLDRAATNQRHAAGIAAANERGDKNRAAADRRATSARAIQLSRLALQAQKEKRTLQELVEEAESFGYEIDVDQ
jgi:hypothetical protein